MSKCLPSYIKCGEVYDIDLPNSLNKSEPPIILGKVSVDIECIPNPTVLIKFSEFINFTLLGINPKINITYRLVKEEKCFNNEQILQEWQFGFESADRLEAGNIDTSQPTVLNYADDLDEETNHKIVYRLEIVEIETNDIVSYSLSNLSITANVMSGLCPCSRDQFPYVRVGEVFNPVLPLKLTKKDKPVLLTKVDVNSGYSNACVLINFSGFVTSVLRDERFNELVFRLVKECSDKSVTILREWDFRRVFTNDTNINEPVVYDYCECLDANLCCIYKMELVKVSISDNSYYDIEEKSMTAQVYLENKDNYYKL